MAEVFIAPLGTDPEEPGWSWLGTANGAVSEVAEPADTTPLADFGTLTAEFKGGTVLSPAPQPPRKHRVRYERPGRPPLYGTLAAHTVDSATGRCEVEVELAPECMRGELAKLWGDPAPDPEALDAPCVQHAPALTPQRIADMFSIPLHLITPEETNP